MTPMTATPWALQLVTDRLPVGLPQYATVVLDSSTLIARYFDAVGRVVELAKHGTNKTVGTPSMSGGGDGKDPQPQTQDDTNTDYKSD